MIYKVPLYIPGIHKESKVMDDLLVLKDSLGVQELITGEKIKVSTTLGMIDFYLDAKDYGYGSFVKESDLNTKNRIVCTKEVIYSYIESFSTTDFELFNSLGKRVHKIKKEKTNVKELSKKVNYPNIITEEE